MRRCHRRGRSSASQKCQGSRTAARTASGRHADPDATATARISTLPSRRKEKAMSYQVLALALLLLLAASPALAADVAKHSGRMAKHSGRIVAVDPTKHALTLEEVGPWTPQHSSLV